MIYKYKDLFITNSSSELNIIKTIQKLKINSKNAIYIFKALNTDLALYKIGRSSDLKTRLKSHKSPLANDLNVLYAYE